MAAVELLPTRSAASAAVRARPWASTARTVDWSYTNRLRPTVREALSARLKPAKSVYCSYAPEALDHTATSNARWFAAPDRNESVTSTYTPGSTLPGHQPFRLSYHVPNCLSPFIGLLWQSYLNCVTLTARW